MGISGIKYVGNTMINKPWLVMMVREVAYWMHVRYCFLHSGLAMQFQLTFISHTKRSFHELFTVESSLLNTQPQKANFKLSFLWEVVSPKIYQLLLQALLSEDIIRFEVMHCTSLEARCTWQSFMELISQSSACEQVTIWAKRRESSVLSRNLVWCKSNFAFTG